MDHETRRLVQHAWTEIIQQKKSAADRFYSKLFELDPSLQFLFKGDLDDQKERLMSMFSIVIRGLDQLDQLTGPMQALGKKHDGYGVRSEHYDTMGKAFLFMVSQSLGASITPETEQAFERTYAFLATSMKAGSAQTP